MLFFEWFWTFTKESLPHGGTILGGLEALGIDILGFSVWMCLVLEPGQSQARMT